MGITSNLAVTGFHYQYAPVLRTKAGELTALGNLQPADKQRTVPILQIVSTPGARFAARLGSLWNGLFIGLDGTHEAINSGNTTNYAALHPALHAAGVQVVPSIVFNAPANYVGAVGATLNVSAPGLITRVPIDQLPNAANWMTACGFPIADADLVIDCGHIAEINPALLQPVVVNALNAFLPSMGAWRSVTLSASAAPRDATGLPLGPNFFPRRDWQLWSAVRAAYPNLNYSDYGIAHRDLTEPPGFAMANATVSPRYTFDADWVLLKGRSLRGVNGAPMQDQYHAHAQAFVGMPNFGGVPNCWGDDRIAQIAAQAGVGPSGSRETWVSNSLNRHMALVANRLP